MKNSFGIYEKSYDLIINAIKSFHEIEKAIIFGSRAMGNFKKGSDVDIAIFGENIKFETTSELNAKLNEEIPIPYYVDILNFNDISSKELKKHIIEEGKVFYLKAE